MKLKEKGGIGEKKVLKGKKEGEHFIESHYM